MEDIENMMPPEGLTEQELNEFLKQQLKDYHHVPFYLKTEIEKLILKGYTQTMCWINYIQPKNIMTRSNFFEMMKQLRAEWALERLDNNEKRLEILEQLYQSAFESKEAGDYKSYAIIMGLAAKIEGYFITNTESKEEQTVWRAIFEKYSETISNETDVNTTI